MKTDNLIDLLAKDGAPRWRFRALLTGAVAGGIGIAMIMFFTGIGFRADIAAALGTVRFLFKFVVTIALAITATAAVSRAGRPAGNLAYAGLALIVAPALLVGAAIVELLVMPESQWVTRLVGHNARNCMTLIPLLAIGPLASLLAALRRGAPSSPGLAGAMAGLAATGIAATFYAANCDDDSPLFVLTWYSLATLMVTLAGYVLGRRLLRW